jgi:hypothetical protein
MASTIAAEHIEDWRGKDVRDPDDESMGKCQEIWFDTQTETPILLSIKSGLFGRHTKMIPIDGAVVGPDYLRVTHAKAVVGDSPNADKEDPPNAVELDEIGKAYGLRFSEQIRLQSATAIEQRRADAAAAKARAEEAETAAREKAAALEDADRRSQMTSAEAEQAKRDADEASEQARRARIDLERLNDDQ